MKRTLLLLAAASSVMPATAAEGTGNPVTEVFAQTCMAHFFRTQGLFEQMKADGATVLEGEAAKFFLTGLPGVAWHLPLRDTDYVVAQRDDGVCAAFAKETDVEKVEQAFVDLVGKAPAPLVATEFPGEKFGPSEDKLKTLAYGWGEPGKVPTLVFAMTTSREDAPLVSAMISLSTASWAKKKPAEKEPAHAPDASSKKAAESQPD